MDKTHLWNRPYEETIRIITPSEEELKAMNPINDLEAFIDCLTNKDKYNEEEKKNIIEKVIEIFSYMLN